MTEKDEQCHVNKIFFITFNQLMPDQRYEGMMSVN